MWAQMLTALRCVCDTRQKQSPKKKWSRWALVPAKERSSFGGDGCRGSRRDAYTTDFTFRAMRDNYVPPRIYLCTSYAKGGGLLVELGCNARSTKSVAYAVLRFESARASDEVFCVGRGKHGDSIQRGENCGKMQLAVVKWSHVGVFAVPPSATGRPWCVGRRSSSGSATSGQFTTSPHSRCDSIDGFEHVLGFREVALADLTEDLASLSLPH